MFGSWKKKGKLKAWPCVQDTYCTILHAQLPWWQMQLHTAHLQLHAQIGKCSTWAFYEVRWIYSVWEDFRNEISIWGHSKLTFRMCLHTVFPIPIASSAIDFSPGEKWWILHLMICSSVPVEQWLTQPELSDCLWYDLILLKTVPSVSRWDLDLFWFLLYAVGVIFKLFSWFH